MQTLAVKMSQKSHLLKEMEDADAETDEEEKEATSGRIRRLLPSRDDAIPVYVVGYGNTVRKKEERLEIWSREGRVSKPKLLQV